MKPRTPWQGMWTIAQFNWPFYIAAVAVLLAAVMGLLLGALITQLICAAAIAGATYFLIGSLGVSHLIYDRSDLYRWHWLVRAVGGEKLHRAVFCHSGFDETSAEIRAQLPGVEWVILDHFDKDRMTEASIRRARAKFPPTPGTLAAPYDRWPLEAASADVVFALLAVHELRTEAERARWFAEASRSLVPSGRVVLVEHLRDLPNFLAFGPGFSHFHSRSCWQRAWEAGGFRLKDDFPVTPWVRVFVLIPV